MRSKNTRGSGDVTTAVRNALGAVDVMVAAHIRSIDSDEEAGVFADESVVAASVFKVAVALEFYRQVSAGELDPSDQVQTTAAGRTPGATGLSLFTDDAVVSLRDLATSMMAVSDNAAPDVLLELVSVERVNETLQLLGATSTHVACDVAGSLATMAAEAGLQTWDEVLREDPSYERLQDSSALRPETANRTTARDMTQLLSAIWTDTAGPADACADVRRLMGLQARGRLANGLAGARVSAKSGSLLGIIRNEVGVVEFANGARYALGVFTRSPRTDFTAGPSIDEAMGRVASVLVDGLGARSSR